jgi:uncharacterized membrane protein
MKLHFPKPFKHRHPPVESTNKLFEAQLTTSQRTADWFAAVIGSWKFLITQSIMLGIWAVLNVAAWLHHWDPYPFILLNLMLSIQAAYAAPIIMMSQNRQADRDRLDAHNDYVVNQKAEEEIRAILEHNTAQNKALVAIYDKLSNLEAGVAGIWPQPSKPLEPTKLNDEK